MKASGLIFKMKSFKPRRLNVLAVRYVVLGRDFYLESELQQMAALARRGYNVRMIVPRTPTARSPPSCLVNHFIIDTIVLRETPYLRFCLFVLFSLFRVAIMAGNVDCIILDPQVAPLLFPIILLRRLVTRSPVLLLRVTSNPTETGGFMKTMLLTFRQELSIKLAQLFFDKILFISPMLRDYYSDRSRIPKSRTGIWPSCVDLNVFHPKVASERRVTMLRKNLQIKEVGMIYHGEITRSRGIMELVKAMELLKQGGVEDAKLILLGYGRDRQEVKEYIKLNGLDSVISIRDPVETPEEVAEYLAACDVEIIPMPDHVWWRFQCFIKVIESLAMNKPLISTDLPAVRAIVDRVPVVHWLRGSAACDIADGIRSYLKSRGSLRPELGRRIASHYSVENIAERLDADITGILHANA